MITKENERRDIEAAFQQLEALGWLTMIAGPRHTDPPHWVVNPQVHEAYAERARSEAERRRKVREVLTSMLGAGAGQSLG